ncbi:MAG: class II aldolase/adducin family protein [Clostridiales bacterium]|nr:class II aldolase/adducin family protein [Clostridiales bacterium]
MHINARQASDEIVKYGLIMKESALVVGTWGNISTRVQDTDLVAITPSGVDYDKTKPEDIVIVDIEGNIIDGELKPSIELPLHLAIYKARKDVNAIVHTHSTYSTSYAIARKEIPATVEDSVQIVGGNVRVTEYCLPGSIELGNEAVKKLEDRNAVLLANHGLLAAAGTLKEALKVAQIIEKAAQSNLFAQLIGGAVELEESDINAMRDFYINKYGQR